MAKKGENMKKLTEQELIDVIGGWSLTGTLVNAFTSAAKTVMDFGRSLGSAIRRIGSNKLCKI